MRPSWRPWWRCRRAQARLASAILLAGAATAVALAVGLRLAGPKAQPKPASADGSNGGACRYALRLPQWTAGKSWASGAACYKHMQRDPNVETLTPGSRRLAWRT